MRRRIRIAALVLGVFVVVGILTFPTDALVQSALDRLPLPDQMTLAFTGARLRPSGLRLEQVHVVRPDGQPAFDAEWLRLQPSLFGFWRDGTGRPWSIGAGTCQGTVEATIGVERHATPVSVTLDNVELASCLAYVRHVDAYGRVSGTATARIETEDPHASEGSLDIRGAAWKPGGPLEDLAVRADAGRLVWRLAERKLELTTIDAMSSDFHASGHGVIRFLDPVDDSVLDFRISITPGTTMPPLFQANFDAIPGTPSNARGIRTFRIGGTLRDPRVIGIDTPP